MDWATPAATLVAELVTVIAKAVTDKNANDEELRAEASASVQRFIATLGGLAAALAADDKAADEAAHE